MTKTTTQDIGAKRVLAGSLVGCICQPVGNTDLAEEFLQQYKGKEGAEQIIGHFGLGFYSSFMVAEKVQIRTLSRHEGSQAVQWESNGTTEYTITDVEKSSRG